MDLILNIQADSVSAAEPTEPVCVQPGTSIREVLAQLRERKVGSILVCDGGQMSGIFTERDALRLLARGDDLDGPVDRVMTASPVGIDADENVAAAIAKMASGGYRRLPIVDAQKRPLGVLQVSNIVHYLVEHFPRTIYNLPPKPHAAVQQREGE